MLRRPMPIIDRVIRERLRPVSRVPPDQWADSHRIVLQPSPMPGPWRTAIVPYQRDWYRDYADPMVRRVLIMCSTQMGKTEFLINCLLWTIDQDPYPALWVVHSRDDVREMAMQRIIPAIKACAAAERHRSTRAWDTKQQVVRFDAMTLHLVGANSAGALASKPVGRLFLDERDKYPTVIRGRGATEAGAVDLAYKRLDSFGDDGKAIEACTPTIEMQGIHAEYLRSDQRKYVVPCPLCGAYQMLKFGADGGGGLRWEGGSGRDLSESMLSELESRVRLSAWYECGACHGRIESHAKRGMLARGVWIAAGQSMERVRGGTMRPGTEPAGSVLALGGAADAGGDQWLITGEAPSTSTRGYQLSSLYSPFQSFGFVAAEFVKKRGNVDQDFVNARLGEPWRVEQGSFVDASRLVERTRESLRLIREQPLDERGRSRGYAKGQIPEEALVLVGACDVQSTGVYWLVMAMCPGEILAAIDWGFTACAEDDPRSEVEVWAEVDAVLQRTWKTPSGRSLRLHTAVIDSGDRTHEVYRACLRLGPWVVPGKGQVQQFTPAEWSYLPVEAEPPRGAAKYVGQKVSMPVVASIELFSMRVDLWKTEVYARLSRQWPAAGSIRVPVDIDAEGSLGGELLRHWTSEHRIAQKVRGQVRGWLWALRPGRTDNHWWDCLVYATAMADALGHARLTEGNAASENPMRDGAAKMLAREPTRIEARKV